MIEALAAQNGSTVLKDQGRWLSSSVDPEAEARSWVSRRREFLDKVRTVFILGAGSGYHIQELSLHTEAMIVVIETRPELITAVRAIHAFDSDRIKIICASNVKQLRASEEVRSAVAQSFIVLHHGPSAATNPSLFQEFQNQLVGRDWGSLHWQWQLKGFEPLEKQQHIHAVGTEPLSILDLEQTELVRDSGEREKMLIKALRELVK